MHFGVMPKSKSNKKIGAAHALLFITFLALSSTGCEKANLQSSSTPQERSVNKVSNVKTENTKLSVSAEDEKRADELFAQGRKLRQEENSAKAAAKLQQSVDLDPRQANRRFLLADCYLQTGELQAAEREVKLGLKTQPNDAAAHHLYGEILQKQNKWQESLPNIKKATELSPETAVFWQSLGETQETLKNIEEAKLSYEKAVELNPKAEYSLRLLGFAYAQLGEKEKAVTILEKVLSLYPDNELAKEKLRELKNSSK